MKYISRLLLSLLLVSGCNNTSQNTPKPIENAPEVVVTPTEPIEVTPSTPETIETVPHEGSTPIGPEYPVANVKKVFTVKITDTNYTAKQKAKLKEATELIAKIFNSEEYKKEILEWKRFTNNKGLKNLEIYEKLFAGAEALIPAVNYQMDLTVTMYFDKSNTVGYTYPKQMKVWTNSNFHTGYTACQVAANLTHEWTHKMGFDHSSASDSNSVPYAHSAIIKRLCVKFL